MLNQNKTKLKNKSKQTIMKTVPKLLHAIILILGLIVLASPFIDSSIPAEAYAFVIILWILYMMASPLSIFKRDFYTSC